jgi:acetyl-CoA carboxylase alpha subunit
MIFGTRQPPGARSALALVYAAGAVQGIVLVTIPAASAVFTSAAEYGLSSSDLLRAHLAAWVALGLGLLSFVVARGRGGSDGRLTSHVR